MYSLLVFYPNKLMLDEVLCVLKMPKVKECKRPVLGAELYGITGMIG